MAKFNDKMLADWLNNVSVALVGASGAGPFIAWSLGVLDGLTEQETANFMIGCVAWVIIAIILHFFAQRVADE